MGEADVVRIGAELLAARRQLRPKSAVDAEISRRHADPRYAWESRVAKAKQWELSRARAMSWPDLVAAVTDIMDDQSRCGGCGLSEQDQWWVKAELVKCPSCADRDLKRKDIPTEHSAGWRVNFVSVEDHLGMLIESSRAMHTPEGHLQRKAAIAEHRHQQ